MLDGLEKGRGVVMKRDQSMILLMLSNSNAILILHTALNAEGLQYLLSILKSNF